MKKVLKNIKPLVSALSVLALLCAQCWTVLAQTPSGTTITNRAIGSFRFKTGAPDSVKSNAAQTLVSPASSPLLLIDKSVDRPSATPGSNLIYTLDVSNQGDVAATSVVLIDSLPENTSFVSASNGGSLQGNMVHWNISNLDVSQHQSVQLIVQIDPSFLSGGITNRASASCREGISAASNLVQTMIDLFVATRLSLTLTSDAIMGDGKDTSRLNASVVDAAGLHAGDGAPVLFSTTHGHFANGKDTITIPTQNGIASTLLTSELVANENIQAEVTATTVSTSGITLSDSSEIIFYAGAITGRVYSIGSKPITVIAIARNEAGVEVSRDTTESGGTYLLPIPTRGSYTVTIRYTNKHGDVIEVTNTQEVDLPSTGSTPPIPGTSAIAGTLVDHAGKPLRQGGIDVLLQPMELGKRTSVASETSVSTDGRGCYVFAGISPGRYRLRIANRQYQGWIEVIDTVQGMLMIDSDIEMTEIPHLEVLISSNKRIAEIGDIVSYTLEVTNTSNGVSIAAIAIVDTLPAGFGYIAGSSHLEGMPFGDPSGRGVLLWQLPDTLRPGGSVKLVYRAVAGAGAIDGDGVNRVFAIAIGPDTVRSAVAEAAVDVRPGVFTDRGIVIGKVFYDDNQNGYQDSKEDGVPGVELWMEDGTRITTDDNGKYSVSQVTANDHVIRVNRATLPTGSGLVAGGTSFAGDAVSRFVSMTEGSVVRADFYLSAARQAELFSKITEAPGLSREDLNITSQYIVRLTDTLATRKIMLTDTLPSGYYYDLRTIAINGEAIKTESKKSRVLSIQLQDLIGGHGDADTIQIAIVADSTHPDGQIQSSGRLILSYPTGRDAEFNAHPILEDHSDVLTFPIRLFALRMIRSEYSRDGDWGLRIRVNGSVSFLTPDPWPSTPDHGGGA